MRIDGSHGEGGGQILRTAAALATLLDRPVEVHDIRAGRAKPGLRPQHAGALRFLAAMTAGTTDAATRATATRFAPGPRRGGTHAVDLGTAGSMTLFLQAVLPVLLLTPGWSRLRLVGGSDVPFAPSMDWFEHVYLHRVAPVADQVRLEVVARGFAPRGGGVIELRVENGGFATDLSGLCDRVAARLGQPRARQGALRQVAARVVAAEALAARRVAERQADALEEAAEEAGLPRPQVHAAYVASASPGTACTVWLEDGHGNRVGGDRLGAPGLPAEAVARSAFAAALADWRAGATVDRHLADHWVPWCALGAGAVRVPRLTGHLETNLWTVSRFLPATPLTDGVLGASATGDA